MKDETKYTETQFVVFKAGDEEFGVDIGEVREIIKLEDVTKIPHSEDFIEGIINLRGNIVVVIDLAKKLNLAMAKKTKDSRIIIVEVGKSTIGMLVDSCNEVIHLSSAQMKEAPQMIKEKIDEEFIQGVGVLNKRLIIMLDLRKAIATAELKKIESISEMHAAA